MTDTVVFERSDREPPGDPAETGDATGTGTASAPGPSWFDPSVLGRGLARVRHAKLETWVTLVVVTVSSVFVFFTLHPNLILTENTPTGGDMGAHVWGPKYLLEHLLPHGRLSGWTPDWYGGFPAFQFYMVLPSLVVVVLYAGIRNLLLVPALAAGVAAAMAGWFVPSLHRWRRVLLGVGIFAVLLVLPVPYGVAFKLTTVAGLISLPLAAWAFGRLSDLPFPGPAILSVASLFFIYNREPNLNGGTGNIIGGNMASTMAGEFAFSISLSLCLLYLGFLVRGMRTGRNRATAAVLLALCGLCHLIPAFFALAVTGLALVIWPGRARLRWLLPTLPVAALLSAWWVVPFLLRRDFLNDMGWEKLPGENALNGSGGSQTVWNYLMPVALWGPLALAAVGVLVSLVYRFRPGWLLTGAMVLSGAGFVFIPQARLWNARVLPFFYLSLFLLAGLGVAEVVRSVATVVARVPERPRPLVGAAGAAVALGFSLVFLGVPLGRVPFGSLSDDAAGGRAWRTPAGTFHREYRNDVPGWAAWNFAGLEGKQAAGPGAKVPEGEGGWPEYQAMVAAMEGLGNDPAHGCGRAFWEYGDRLETYGTPMAPMLLPYFTDGCIGSMEGLYFESSATTPYHFLNQCELSDKGSCAQRDLAYGSFDLDLGIKHLGLLGVKYYMAFTDRAVDAAAKDDRLTEVAVAGPWHVYELPAPGSSLVTPLEYEPVVMDNVSNAQDEWLDPSAAWFLDPNRWDVPLAADGPDDWARLTVPDEPAVQADGTDRPLGRRDLPEAPRAAVTPARVSAITTDDDRISFDVDRIGSPVLVKASYFPNWEVSGADGPYRVTPNLMVVVPTSEHVSLHYGRTAVDWLAIILTLLGLVGLFGLTRLASVTMPEPRPSRRRRDEFQRDVELWGTTPATGAGTGPVSQPWPPDPGWQHDLGPPPDPGLFPPRGRPDDSTPTRDDRPWYGQAGPWPDGPQRDGPPPDGPPPYGPLPHWTQPPARGAQEPGASLKDGPWGRPRGESPEGWAEPGDGAPPREG